MAQTQASKPLTSYADTEFIRAIAEDFGDRLEVLSAGEKYQLLHALSGYLAQIVDGDASLDDIPLDVANECSSFAWSGDVEAVLDALMAEEPQNISALLPAIAQYAHDDDRDE